ncbi:MAG: hypothetical protein QF464_01805 [Myxococcota bacterium]|nr:hypothetical protein [Myxococcota bacterium]
MRAWCVIATACLALGCSGESSEPPGVDSENVTYPTAEVSGGASEGDSTSEPTTDTIVDTVGADAEPPEPTPEDTSEPPPSDVVTPTPDASILDTPSPTPDVSTVDASPPSPEGDAPDANAGDDATDTAPTPDGSDEPSGCLDLVGCTVACSGEPGCQQACIASATQAAASEAQALKTCRQTHCDGLGGPNGLLCTISDCTCESATCGACDGGCADTGAESCDEMVNCLMACGLMGEDLSTAIADTCCFMDCHAQATGAAQVALDICVDCIQANCGGANLIQCATGPCATDCAPCTPPT